MGEPAARRSRLLIRQYLDDGCARSLGELVELNYEPVVRLVEARLGRRVGSDVGDYVQLGFQTAILRLDQWEERSEGYFRNWIAKIAFNAFRDARKKRSITTADSDLLASLPEPAAEAPGTREPSTVMVVLGEAFRRLRTLDRRLLAQDEVFLSLAEDDRVILAQHDAGMTDEELAEELGLKNKAAVQARRYQAKARLKRIARDISPGDDRLNSGAP